jgi:oligopeptide/dipeptide ABC transporter ATP-binding protein
MERTAVDDRRDPLLVIEGLRVVSARGEILRGVDLIVGRGEIMGLVGESGCGKTTLGLAVLGLLGRSRWIVSGTIRLDGAVIGAPAVDGTAPLRGHRIAFIPQDPFRAFDPLRRIGPQVRRPLELHRDLDASAAERRVAELLGRLGVPDPTGLLGRYPHQLSGGMLQRAAIATALACDPELVVADEPTTALDVLVQLQVIESFVGVVREQGTSLLVITHDLRLLERMADRVAAMYAGKVVEFGPVEQLLTSPRHHYPAGLLASSVLSSAPGQRIATIDGQPPTLPGVFAPCAFAPRCPRADAVCWSEEPHYSWPAESGYACHHPRMTPVAGRLEDVA